MVKPFYEWLVDYEGDRCYACNRVIRGRKRYGAITIDNQMQFVGIECARMIDASGVIGYQPPTGGPRLFSYYLYPIT